MQPASPITTLERSATLNELIPIIRTLPTLDKLRLIRVLATELENMGDVFPLEVNKTYYLPTPYNSFGAAAILAEAMESYQQEESNRS